MGSLAHFCVAWFIFTVALPFVMAKSRRRLTVKPAAAGPLLPAGFNFMGTDPDVPGRFRHLRREWRAAVMLPRHSTA
jgi:hypothetical protein